MKFPISPDTPEDNLVKEISQELCIAGVKDILCLTTAIRIMRAVDIGHNDPNLGVEYLQKRREKVT